MSEQITPKPRNNRKILYGAIALFICCVCLVGGYLVNPGQNESLPQQPSGNQSNPSNPSASEADTSTPVPTTPPDLGKTRENPIPGAEGVNLSGDIKLTILETNRDASAVVIRGNMFNPTPSPTQAYITVKIHVECGKASDQTCSFFPSNIKAVGSDGQIKEKDVFINGIPEEFTELSYEFFGGGSITGNLVFLLPKDDPNIILIYEPFLSSPVYISLP